MKCKRCGYMTFDDTCPVCGHDVDRDKNNGLEVPKYRAHQERALTLGQYLNIRASYGRDS